MMRESVRDALAPEGVLRAGINYANAAIAARDAATGALSGVSVDLVTEIAQRLDVPLVLTGYPSSGTLVAALIRNEIDIGGVAGGPGSGRETVLDFSGGYLHLEVAYLVPPGSAIERASDVDRAGVRVGVAETSAFAAPIARGLARATLVTGPGNPTAFGLLRSGEVDVLAGLRDQLATVAREMPGARVLEETVLTIEQRLAIPKGRGTALAYVTEFVEEAKASGFIARALGASGGASAA